MSAEKVLIDTSVWIDYFKNSDPGLSSRIDDVLSAAEVYVPGVVLAELVQGARSEREIAAIKDMTETFRVVDHGDGAWFKAGKLSYELRKAGKAVHLADCYIAVIARENGCRVITRDEHFKAIGEIFDFELSAV